MELRQLGRSGLKTAPIVFGGNVLGWTADQATGFKVLDAFVAAGFNAIDTADTYSRWVPGNKGGESETIIGNWLKKRGRRDNVLIFTKVGHEMAPDKKGLSRRYIKAEFEDSLRRLQTDYVDLYQSHRDDASVPMEETMETYSALIKEGKVRALAITAKKRLETLPNVPTLADLGVPGQEAETMTGVFVPVGTPRPIVDQLQREIATIVNAPDTKARLLELGIVPEGDSSAEFAAYVKDEIAKWKRVIEVANIPKI